MTLNIETTSTQELLDSVGSVKAQVIDELVVEIMRLGVQYAVAARAYHLAKASGQGVHEKAAERDYYEILFDAAKKMLSGLQSSLKIDRLGMMD